MARHKQKMGWGNFRSRRRSLATQDTDVAEAARSVDRRKAAMKLGIATYPTESELLGGVERHKAQALLGEQGSATDKVSADCSKGDAGAHASEKEVPETEVDKDRVCP